MISLSHPGAHAALRGLDRRNLPRVGSSIGLRHRRGVASVDNWRAPSPIGSRLTPRRERIVIACIVAVTLAICWWMVATTPAHAHDSWISQGAHRNAAGEWCCGDGDCFVTSATPVTLPAPGYRLPSGEFVPEAEAQRSLDDQYWRCQRADGSRRCFFAPPKAS